MQLEENKIYEVLKKIEIRIQGQTISKEKLLKSFGQYLSQTFSKRDHNIGLIMHTGSVCFDAMLVTYAMIFNLISNKVETGDVVNSFSEGDIVLYGQNKKSRYFFGGFVDGSEIRAEIGKKYIKLTQGGTSVNYIPEKSWRNIEPYNGDSVRMDGRGIRKKSSLRDDFFVEVLGFTKENIPSVLDTSCVIVAPRDRVDYLVKNISLAFGKKKISLLELVTASYFTEEDEYRYGGNAGKNEPTLKFTAKVSAARQLLLSRQGNRHLGLIVLGEDSISRGYSELHELINRKSLQYVYLSSSIDSELAFALTSDIEETEVFACTKDFLLENSTTDIAEINDYTLKLSKQVNTIIEKDNKLIVLEENGLEKEIVYEFKKIIIAIKRNEYSTDGKERFIMLAYSLMKLFVTAPFPMDRFSVAREKGIIDVSTPREKIKEMEVLLTEFPNDLREKATLIVHILEKVLEREENITAKYEWLRKYLYSHVGEKTAIVVPKAYYITMLKGSGLFSDYFFRKKDFTTPNRFDNSQMYECVIVLGIDVARLNVMLLVGQPKLTSEYIQASSRVGRSYPGVAFTMYDGSKSRDRSHYEQFVGYHESFYKHVEPTGVTPFSKPARDRALHAIIIALLRQLVPELTPENAAGKFTREKYKKEIDSIVEYIVTRNNDIISKINPGTDTEENEIREEISVFLDSWENLEEGYEDDHFFYGEKYMINYPEDGDARLMKAYNTGKNDNAFDTMTSMRNVDISVGSSVLIWKD